jgi:hypothetical protein
LYHRLSDADARFVNLDTPIAETTGNTPLHQSIGFAKLQASEYLLQSGVTYALPCIHRNCLEKTAELPN